MLSHKKVVQWNPVNTDTEGTGHSVLINWVFEKIYELFFPIRTNITVCYIQVSILSECL